MKVLLATLALLPVISSQVYFQLPQIPVSSRSSAGRTVPLGLHQYTQQQQQDTQANQKEPEEASERNLSQREAEDGHRSSQELLRQELYRDSADLLSDQALAEVSRYPSWGYLFPSVADARFKPMTENKRSGNYEFTFRIPDELVAQSKRSYSSASSGGYLVPSALHQPISLRPETYSRFALGHRSLASSLASNAQLQDGAKKSPAKRYLGIELPDYIASNYGADKSSNTKLHNLKQRMRSVGK